jgi:NAD(P)-dependent dehydrogenase (short-subunit alcohol dehydrogenase family)
MSDAQRGNFQRRAFLGGTVAAAGIAAMASTTAAGQDSSLKGKSVLITGCSSGFGRLAALHLARQGATVIASMRNLLNGQRSEALTLAAEAKKEGLKLSIIEIDVTDDAQVSSGVAQAETIAGGALDALVNNAGIAIGGPVEMQDMEAAQAMFSTNVLGPLRMARAALPAMRTRRSGVIFNVTSQLGRLIAPNYGLYSSTKFALEAQSEQLAYELAQHGVEVTIIQPGGYPTLIWKNSAAATDRLLKRVEQERAAGYPALIATARRGDPCLSTDPMDVPRSIAEILALPAGRRPLRRPVHPTHRPQEPINAVSAEAQRKMLGRSPFGPWVEAVLD